MAQSSILGRVSQLIRANINAILDSAEDPEKMLDQLVRDFTNNIAEAEDAVAQTIGNLRLIEDDAREARQAAAEWLDKAKGEGDLIFSGSEVMMSDFVSAMGGQIAETTITPLYLRPSAILVRPGNPKGIKGFTDLLARDLKVLVVNGAGQQGLWEDMVGRSGDIGRVRTFRSKIVAFAPNSAAGRKTWTEQPDIDAWIIWNIWQVANPSIADVVEVEPEYRIYRDTGIGLTVRGQEKSTAKAFVNFLQSPEGAAIFRKWGWVAN